MVRDDRYDLIKSLIEKGKITYLQDIFRYVPKTVVSLDVANSKRINKLAENAMNFTLSELKDLGKLCELSKAEMLTFIDREFEKNGFL